MICGRGNLKNYVDPRPRLQVNMVDKHPEVDPIIGVLKLDSTWWIILLPTVGLCDQVFKVLRDESVCLGWMKFETSRIFLKHR